jgi:hypothetical protein
VTQNALTDRYLRAFAESGPPARQFVDELRDSITDTSYFGAMLSRPGFLERCEVDRVLLLPRTGLTAAQPSRSSPRPRSSRLSSERR